MSVHESFPSNESDKTSKKKIPQKHQLPAPTVQFCSVAPAQIAAITTEYDGSAFLQGQLRTKWAVRRNPAAPF